MCIRDSYYTDPGSQGGVFDSGDNVWVGMLGPCPPSARSCPSAMVRKMTGNLLWLFGQGPAGRFVPAKANWHNISPPRL